MTFGSGTSGGRRWLWALWAFWPEVSVVCLYLLLLVLGALIVPKGGFLLRALVRASTAWGIIFGIFLPLGAVHLLRCLGASLCLLATPRRSPAWRRNKLLVACDGVAVAVCYLTLSLASEVVWSHCWAYEPSDGASAADVAASLHFPANFRFGAATSAYQVEGGLYNSNWYDFEQHFRHPDGSPAIKQNQSAGKAADVWERFPQDLAHMRELHMESFRLSFAWSRLHPKRGSFDHEAMARYRSWLVDLRNASIEPMVTLLHYDEPIWIAEQGSWTNENTIEEWLHFVKFVVNETGDLVDLWITQNEPFVMTGQGYLEGIWPPGIVKDFGRWWAAMTGLMEAHIRGHQLIHEVDTIDADGDGHGAQVSIAKNFNVFWPLSRWNVFDPAMAGTSQLLVNTLYLGGIDGERSLDWVGINHYYRMDVGFPRLAYHEMSRSLYSASCEINRMFPGKTIHVTEHGKIDPDMHDEARSLYVTQSLAGLQQAVDSGVSVASYQHWSLIDNFEWDSGFLVRFGLYHVDFDTQMRTPRDFALLYRSINMAHKRRHHRGAASEELFA